jgi:PIN domain nuclease of toxin-antitoxin system
MTSVLDTHAAIWYLYRSRELSSAALQSIRRAVEGGEPVYVSVISLVEAKSPESK